MLYTPLTKKAMIICFEAHKYQKDKSGLPYVFHPFHLAEQMNDETTTIIALLHDVVEDTDITFDDLKSEGFPKEVTDALRLLTHSPDVPYMDYIANIKNNKSAKEVKLADLRHNSDMSRYDTVTERDIERQKKYLQAINILSE